MKAKLIIAACLLLFVSTVPVIAQGNGNGGGNSAETADDAADESEDDGDTNSADENGNSGRNGGVNNGNGSGSGNADTNGHPNAVPDGNGNRNNNGGAENGTGTGSVPTASDEVTVVPEEDLLAIVKAGQAVSLSSLLPSVQQRTGGEIIDAQLVRTTRSLIYVVKVLTPDGHVGIEYYNARSGIHIEAR